MLNELSKDAARGDGQLGGQRPWRESELDACLVEEREEERQSASMPRESVAWPLANRSALKPEWSLAAVVPPADSCTLVPPPLSLPKDVVSKG